MKHVKLSSKIAIICYLVLSIAACSYNENGKVVHSEDNPSRISLIDRNIIKGQGYYIIKVDDQEFICNGSGGIYPLSDCR